VNGSLRTKPGKSRVEDENEDEDDFRLSTVYCPLSTVHCPLMVEGATE